MRRKYFFTVFFIHLCLFSNLSFSQSADSIHSDSLKLFQRSPTPIPGRIKFLNYSIAGAYGISMYWLYTQWYKDYPGSSFHLFNDNSEWLQMDKCAHAMDGYLINKALTRCYSWAGFNKKKSLLYGAGITFMYQTTIEVFDGFSEEWGFSFGDIGANLLGQSIFILQEMKWNEQRITLKFSFHQTEYPGYRPQVLGSNLSENIVKDYNGQTNWVCINPYSFWKNSSFPAWLSLAFGYGAEGMTGGESNPVVVDGETIPEFERYRQFYLSLDIELTRIETRSAFLSSLFKVVNVIHLPAPAIEFPVGGKAKFHTLYF